MSFFQSEYWEVVLHQNIESNYLGLKYSFSQSSIMALISTGRCSSDRELTVTEAAPIWRRLDVECIPEGCGLAIWTKKFTYNAHV